MVDLQRDVRNPTYLNHVSSDPVCCHPAHRMFLGCGIHTRCTISTQAADFALELYLHAIVLSGFSRGAQLGVFNFNRTLARLPRNCSYVTRLNQLCCRESCVLILHSAYLPAAEAQTTHHFNAGAGTQDDPDQLTGCDL